MNLILRLRRLVILSALAMLAASAARAQTLLIINDSNLANLTVTGTGADAGTNNSNTNENNGVDLLGFFTSPYATMGTLNTGFFGTESLTPSGTGTTTYTTFYADDFSGTTVDLDLFNAQSFTQVFSTNTPAFTGVMAGNFTPYAAIMPGNGATGSILSGYSGLSGAQIGTWEVVNTVPEPSFYGLLAGAFALGAAAWRKRRG
jgi:hypothetical protein